MARSLIGKDATALQKVVLKSEMKIKSAVRGRGGDKKGSRIVQVLFTDSLGNILRT